MPNRIVREGINSSDRVDLLSDAAEVFYRRLLNVVDDYGRFDGRPSLLIAACYPLRLTGKRRVGESNITHYLNECRIAGLVVTYEAAGKSFLEVTDFRQQVRSKLPKYPAPPADAQMLRTCVADATQTPSTRYASAHLDGDGVVDVSVVGGGDGDDAREAAATGAPPGVSPDNWSAWRKHRGKKFTAEAERLQRKHLAQWRTEGHDPNRIVENALAGGWQGLHPPDQPKGNGHGRHSQRSENIAELTGRTNRERTVEGTTDRLGGTPVPALSGHLRKPRRDDVG